MYVPPINLPSSAGVPVNIDTGTPTMPTNGTDKELHDAARDFVGILYGNMFREMREAGQDEEGEGMFNSFETQMFMGFFDEEIGNKFADQGGHSMTDALYNQINKKGKSADPTPVAHAPGTAVPSTGPAAPTPPTAPGEIVDPVVRMNGSLPPPMPTGPSLPATVPAPALPPPAALAPVHQPIMPAGLAPVVTPPPLPPEMPGISHQR